MACIKVNCSFTIEYYGRNLRLEAEWKFWQIISKSTQFMSIYTLQLTNNYKVYILGDVHP